MRGLLRRLSALLAVAHCAGIAGAEDIPFITDLKLFSSLAPCAASAIADRFYAVSYSMTQCGEGETQMHSCFCSHTADFNSYSSLIASTVTSSCSVSSGNTEDISSASLVLKKYCNLDSDITFAEPEHKVNAFITELSQTTILAPCAQSALSYVVLSAGNYRCPQEASLWAPCICSKSGVVEDVNRSLSSVARTTCYNNEDGTSAQQFYSDYCAMNDGTTEFATGKNPPGDMSYHITALPQFKSLRQCAQSAVSSAVLIQSGWLCGSGPQALASCVCLKSGIFDKVSSTLRDEVKYECDSTAIADITSAVDVLEYYCSAADDKVVASVDVPPASTTEGASSEPTSAPAESESRSSAPAETGSTGGDNDKNGADSDNSNGEDSGKESGESSTNRTAIIAAAVLGAFLVLVGIAAVVFFLRRKRRREAKGEEIPSAPAGTEFQEFQEFNGKPELAGPDPPPSRPGTGHVMKAELPTTASYNELPTPTTPNQAANAVFPNRRSTAISDLSPTDTVRPELPTTAPHAPPVPPMPYVQQPQELVSPAVGQYPPNHLHVQPMHGYPNSFPVSPQSQRGSPINGFPAYPPPTAQGWEHRPQQQQQQQAMGWQSGPVQAYEMDANVGSRGG